MYLNLLGYAPENEAALKYHFAFLTKEQVEAAAEDETKKWFPVAESFAAAEPAAMMQVPAKYNVGNNTVAVDMIAKLWQEVHHSASLHFYEEDDQDIERVLDIFVRVNSGGTVLSYSDLLLSIATAQWKGDARAAVHDLVDSLNKAGQGFDFAQDTVLKSGLVLADVGDIAFKVKNFTTANMATLESRWDALSSSLQVAVGLLSDFGLSGATLTADSVLIPVAYYVHRRGLNQSYRFSDVKEVKADRAALRSWVLRSLIVRGVWGSGLDTLLRELREVIKKDGADRFPLAAIERAMALRGKSLDVTDALVEDILALGYGGARTWAVLATLFDHVDTKMQYHVDHVFPQAELDAKELRSIKTPDGERKFSDAKVDDIVSKRDLLPNLELLPGPVNIGKSATAPDEWVAKEYPDDDERRAFYRLNALPTALPHSVDDFLTFFEARRTSLAARIKDKLKTQDLESAPATSSVTGEDIDESLAEGDVGE